MKYFESLLYSMTGAFTINDKRLIRCRSCGQNLSVPTNKGQINIRCPKCGFVHDFSPRLLTTQLIGMPLLLLGGIFSGALFGYLNYLYNITGFFAFFIFPWGAMIFAALANLGFFAVLTVIRLRGVYYPSSLVIVLASLIALLSFWGGEYLDYSKARYSEYKSPFKNMVLVQGKYVEKVENNDIEHGRIGLFEYVQEKHKRMTLRFFFRAGNITAITPDTGIHTGSVGLILLLLELGALVLTFPIIWSFNASAYRNAPA